MPRKAKELTPGQIKALKPRYTDKPTLVPVGGIAGMHIQITPSGSKSWAVRLTVNGKRHWLGLGSYPEISMADARNMARQARQLARDGVNPIEKRRRARNEARAESLFISFSQVLDGFIPIKQQELSPGKYRNDWGRQLKKYAYPHIRAKAIEDVDKYDIALILQGMRDKGLKNETVGKVQQALKEVFRYAIAQQYYFGQNPAEKQVMKYVIGKEPVEQSGENYPSLKVDDVGRFWTALQARDGMGAAALRFQMMTATRPGAVRFATWDEFDLDAMVWTVQPGREASKIPKGARDAKRVPLTPEMVGLLQSTPRLDGSPYVFWAPQGGALSDATLSKVMKVIHAADVRAGGKGFTDAQTGEIAVPHGNRSTFRTWVQDKTTFDPNLAEAALWHTLGSKVERAYARSDMLEKRRNVMQSWVRFTDETARLYALKSRAEIHKALIS
ncbi:MAG: integrase arm-type DNA-binding domain-containing protein [Rhodobacteraceae bacterium]|nr:integrase arm-type DNA-binding domain-containing protein [Paracoccaceae bacterium]